MSRRAVENARTRIKAIRAEIAAMELISSGSLQRRMTRCGKPGCRCMKRDERHGPYFEWGRMQGKRQVSTFVSETEALQLRNAIAAYRRIRALLRRWERDSVRIIKHESDASADQERS
jgi:hypothetical protein